MPASSFSSWFLDGLLSLKHSDPSSVQDAFLCKDKDSQQDGPDHQMYNLTLWLEDRMIRQWGIERRNKLRENFWSTVDSYLRDLECPENYMVCDSIPWREVPKLRVRVVYWLVSCAISEAYAEHQNEEEANINEKKPTNGGTLHTLIPEKVNDFPLGFSTGDLEVDRALTVLRMQFLLEIEGEQKAQNEFLAKKIKERIQSQHKINEGANRKEQNRSNRK